MKHVAKIAALVLIAWVSTGCSLLGLGVSTITLVNDTEYAIPFVGAAGTRSLEGISTFPGLLTNYTYEPIEPGASFDFFVLFDDIWAFLVFVDLQGATGYTTPLSLVDFVTAADRHPGRFVDVVADSGGLLRRGDHLEIRIFELAEGGFDFESTITPGSRFP